MGEIITFVGGLICGLLGILVVPLNQDLKQNKMTELELLLSYCLWGLFVSIGMCVILRGWYIFALEFNYPIFPPVPKRTPLDWLLSAVGFWVLFTTYGCALINNFYNQLRTPNYYGTFQFKRKWQYLTVFYFLFGLVAYLFQVFRYGWWPW